MNKAALRVALLAGTLGQGGAEKQLVYIVASLIELGADVRVFSLTRGEFWEPALRSLGVQPIWIGRFSNPGIRVGALARVLIEFKPHILQSAHFFTNLYVTIAGRLCGTMAIGSIRCDADYGVKGNGYWGKPLIRLPPSLLTNSFAAKRNAERLGVEPRRIHVLPNVIDISDFTRQMCQGGSQVLSVNGPLIIAVGNLIAVKRFDRFLTALAIARQKIKDLKGIVVGDGPEKHLLESMAADLGLLSHNGVRFVGRRHDVAKLLSHADMLVLASDHEGFPNVLLEAMAARLPVVATPAGDAENIVQDGVTGFLVQFDDAPAMAERIVRLARSADLRRRLGEAGRRRVEQHYDFKHLAVRLKSVYRDIARQQNRRPLMDDFDD